MHQHLGVTAYFLCKAALTSFGSGQTIYFKSFDLDDPSTDAAPVDSNGAAGNDNRGGIGTAQQYGILSVVGGNGTTNSVSAKTDANGIVSVDLMVTMQPGEAYQSKELLPVGMNEILSQPGEYRIQAVIHGANWYEEVESNRLSVRITEATGLNRNALN